MLFPRKARRFKYDQSSEEEESSEEECCLPRMTIRPRIRSGFPSPTDPYWEDVCTHPLFLQKYCIPSILNIQHALVVGIQTGNTEAIHALLQFGAEVNFYRGSRDEKPSKSTRIRCHSDRVEIDNPPLFTAVQYGHVDIVKHLLGRGADPQRYTPSPLYRAVEDGRRDLISILLKHDMRSQKSALKLSVLRRDYSMVEFLLSAGINASEHGHAGLYTAEMKGYEDIATLLKLQGATVDALSEADKVNWEVEDKDGTDRPTYYPRCFLYVDPEIDENE
jgi:ankyrin repeat protein